MQDIQEDNFKFFLPVDIEKGTNGKGNKVYKISGQASKQRRDSQGETMSLAGMDVSNLKVINWNHKSKDNPDAYIGEVHSVSFKDDEMHFKGELFPEMPMAKGCINLMKALKKRGKQLGISIEGSVVERGSTNPQDPAYGTVTKSRLTALAVTPNPINSDTYAELVEKGFTTSNIWEFDAETEVIMKSYENGELEKAFTAEANQDLAKEDVEGPKNKKGNEKEEKEEEDKQSLSNKVSKGDVYERIFDYFYDIDIKKAKTIYNLIEKITTMADKKEITNEEISKAFSILEGSPIEEVVEKSEQEIEADADYAKMVSKATDIVKGMVTAGLEGEEVVDAMIEKGFGQKVIDEAVVASKETTSAPVIVNNNEEVLKALEISNININKKFSAIADIYKSQSEQLGEIQTENAELREDLEKSAEIITSLNDTINSFAKKPGQRRSVTKFSDKNFEGNEGQAIQKSEGSSNKGYDLSNFDQRKALVARLTEESGINKGAGYDQELITIAQHVEIAKGVDDKSLGRLNAMGIEILG